MSNAFRARGHECFTVDFDPQFPSSLHIDIMDLTADMVREKFGQPDIIFSANDCTTCSVAAIGCHRKKNYITGVLEPMTEKARRADLVNRHTLDLIRDLHPKFFFIENPVGALRKMDYMMGIPRYTTSWCQYGFKYRKATDIWTNHPRLELKPPCSNGDKCHEAAPRGSKTGLQGVDGARERSMYPKEFCEHIVDICERYYDLEPRKVKFGMTLTCRDLFL